ncbi:MAG: helix-turn-helix domain-containing protein [Acidobacteriaceae bacterium]
MNNGATAETIAVAEKIRLLCSVVTKIARADLQTRLDRHDSGLTAIEHGVLRHLSRGVDSMAAISRLMGVAPSTLVYVVDGLVKKQLVRRGQDPSDRRREPLLLEKRGAALFGQIPGMDGSSVLVQSLEGMKDSRRRELVALLDEFAQGLPGWEKVSPRAEAEKRARPVSPRKEWATGAGKGRKP